MNQERIEKFTVTVIEDDPFTRNYLQTIVNDAEEFICERTFADCDSALETGANISTKDCFPILVDRTSAKMVKK